jgi:hypothetical protein
MALSLTENNLTSEMTQAMLRAKRGGNRMAEIGVHARGLPGLPDDHARIPVWNAQAVDDWCAERLAATPKPTAKPKVAGRRGQRKGAQK